MSELDPSIAAWRAGLARTGIFSSWQLDELEDHLRSELALQIDAGRPWPKALEQAAAQIGAPFALATEYLKENHMNPISKLVGLAGSLLFVGLALAAGGNLGSFLHLPALGLVLGIVSGGLVAGFGPRHVALALRESLSPNPGLERERIAALSVVLRRGYRLAWAAGAIGVIVGTVQVLSSLSDPALIGPGLATAILTLLYGALLAEVGFATLTQWLESARQPSTT